MKNKMKIVAVIFWGIAIVLFLYSFDSSITRHVKWMAIVYGIVGVLFYEWERTK